MVLDGERIRALLRDAQRDVLLCAPFIKAGVLKSLLSEIKLSVSVRIVTRWRAAEVATGVSDLAVFDVANDRANTELALLDDLHAKLYVADDDGLVGSANLTATALGWAERNNVEILVPMQRNTPEILRLLKRLETAVPATFAIRSAIAAEAETMVTPKLDEGQDMIGGSSDSSSQSWLPRCAAPEKLWVMYQNVETTAVVEDTLLDGLADLRDLHIPYGLDAENFEEAVQETLLLMPGLKRIIDQIPQGVTDADGIELVAQQRPSLTRTDATRQWRIVRDWIAIFFGAQFEVAPDSFVTRLKRR